MVLGIASQPRNINGVWYQDYQIKDDDGIVKVKEFMHKNGQWVPSQTANKVGVTPEQNSEYYKINIEKMIPNTEAGISLKKNVINLEKSLVDLSKKKGINLSKQVARVAAVMDYSGSMRGLYRDGNVQRAMSRLMPIALRLDDDGELQSWLFHDNYVRIPDNMSLTNFSDYVKMVLLAKGGKMGGTNYAPVLEDIKRYYINENPDSSPVFVIFITDGTNFDKRQTDKIIRELSKTNIFIQFIGIGYTSFDYLEKLDDLSGRECDNTGFIKVADFDRLSDEELYDKVMEQYFDWLKVKGF